ncbi:hypothetical protein GOP47_0020079 [Adiantum capillus-veneris]|uniref:Uncharacterized protein n=1 Tax=Adiantum capillus-veneris TaxID=13818 RepID=A0A9D4UDN9_ADICA|nr:hypothetical protein GOP47_0020079 [Adiantum capillus-veneris]
MDWVMTSEDSASVTSNSESSFDNDEEDEVDAQGLHIWRPNPLDFTSSMYFYFDRETYNVMVLSLQDAMPTTLEDLKGYKRSNVHDLKKWRRFRGWHCLVIEDEKLALCLKQEPKLKIACIEDWQGLVLAAHCNKGRGIIKVLMLPWTP